MLTFIFDHYAGFYYLRGTGEPLNQYIPDTFAKVMNTPYFRCIRLCDGREEYYARLDPNTDTITLKISKL